MINNLFTKIQNSIEKGGKISPFLFLWENLELLHADVENFIWELFASHEIDAQSLFHLVDTGEAIKIDEIKKFLANGNTKSRFSFQIFFIENISRMTPQSANACLKFFEEPGEWNIIFLSNTSQSWVLETILSRVQEVTIQYNTSNKKNTFFISMISSHVWGNSDELVRYFFSWKYEKNEYVDFLKSIVNYIAESWKYLHLLDELHEDIGWVWKNNLQGKYVVDKYITLLKD